MPCAISSWFGSCRSSIAASATRAHSSDSIAPSSAMVIAGPASRLSSGQPTCGQESCGSDCGMPPNRRADGRHVEVEQPHGQRAGHQADDGARHWRRPRASAPAPERHSARPGPDQAERGDGERDGDRVGARRGMRQRAQLEEEIRRQLVHLQPEEVLELRQDDQHGDAVGEADDDGDRHEAHQVAEPEQRPSAAAARRRAWWRAAGWRRRSARRWRRPPPRKRRPGPPICTREPPSAETTKPATMAVNRPASGFRPEAMAKASASGRATAATVSPAARSAASLLRS